MTAITPYATFIDRGFVKTLGRHERCVRNPRHGWPPARFRPLLIGALRIPTFAYECDVQPRQLWSRPARVSEACTGSGCLDTVLQLRRPVSTDAPDGLRGAT